MIHSSQQHALQSYIRDTVILGLVGILAISSSAWAASTATVTATVTVQNVSVSVADGSISYGTLPNNSSSSTIAADLNDRQIATNNGNVSEQVNIRGTNSADWTLAGSAGADQYVHRFCNLFASSCASPATNYVALTTSYQQLATSTAVAASSTFDLMLTTPNPSSVFTEQSVDVTVQAVGL
jgi:hypothetical protein